MAILYARYSKGQMKIQQMAFVLVALMIFFGMAALVYFSFSMSNLKQNAQELKDKEGIEIVKKISTSPEFAFGGRACSSCVDFDKILILKENAKYKKFWNLDYLTVEKVSNKTSLKECDRFTYPDCEVITVVKESGNFGAANAAFVTLARWDSGLGAGGGFRYELGKIYASGRNLSRIA